MLIFGQEYCCLEPTIFKFHNRTYYFGYEVIIMIIVLVITKKNIWVSILTKGIGCFHEVLSNTFYFCGLAKVMLKLAPAT